MSVPIASILLFGKTTPRRLELTLDSLVGQSEANFEILLPADELDPECARILSAYGDKRIRVLPNHSACKREARGWGLVVFPAGDIWHPMALARLGGMLAASQDISSVLGDAVLLSQGRREPLPPGPPPLSARLIRNSSQLARLELRDKAAVAQHFRETFHARGEPLVWVRDPAPDRAPKPGGARIKLYDDWLDKIDIETDRPPTLHVVVDTEAEFDWNGPFRRDLLSVTAIDRVRDAQAIFDQFGIRPIYMVDYPVATDDRALEALRPILARRGAVVGAHLHPWTTPPFIEPLSVENSFAGNLDRDVEAAKLDTMLQAVAHGFHTLTPFYKAGRYGFGKNTAGLLAARGVRADFSLLPETNLARHGGPNFHHIKAGAYKVAAQELLSVTMTRVVAGSLKSLPGLGPVLDGKNAVERGVRSAFARLGWLERLTLSPEGMSAADQIRLLQKEWLQGRRVFVLHFHSPSLAPGHTPYVRTEEERRNFLFNLRDVCTFFFTTLGGLPGRPQDLLSLPLRGYGS
jgi:hypothetical protein